MLKVSSAFLFLVILCCFGGCCYGITLFDPYLNRYNIHKQQAYPQLLTILNGESVLVTGLRAAYDKSLINSTYLATEKTSFTNLLSEFQTLSTNPIYTSDDDGKRRLLNIVHNKLIWQTPNIYNDIKFLNITTPGPSAIPIDQIFYIVTEKDVEIVWNLIKTTTPTGRCQAWVKMTDVMGNISTSAKSAFTARWNVALCKVTPTTMVQWYTVFKNVISKYNYFPYNVNTSPELSVDAFIRVIRAYRPTVYDSYFTPTSAPSYPLVDGMLKYTTFTNYTNTQKAFIKNSANYFKNNFATLSTVTEKQNYFSMYFSFSIDLSYSYYKTLGGIDFDGNNASFMEFLMWTCQKDILQIAYTAAGGA